MLPNSKAFLITVIGRVQGVGFRPFIFSMAANYCICGTVQNNMDGVKIWAEGSEENLFLFIENLKKHPPRISRIDQLLVEEVPVANYSSFSIVKSDRDGKSSLVIPIDTAICDDCSSEMNDPTNFRYNYPFINCTQCGPRYTIIQELPYDRPFTTMSEFEMCDECRTEYEDPLNRRHHAQPIACPSCGPDVFLHTIKGEWLSNGKKAIADVQTFIEQGKIIAIKGIGGYHLVCDAEDREAILTLRKRKNRPNRPLAVMAKSLAHIENVAIVNLKESELLQSPEAPIVLLQKNNGVRLPDDLAPNMSTLGLFLPYAPLHKLLFKDNLKYLVMTSANFSGLPMLYKDEESFSYLKDIADYVLSSNRKIEHPIDDSVVQVINDEIQFLRRARGYVPDPFFTKSDIHNCIALGPQQKNTFTIGRYNQIFVGPHIGDMGSVEVVDHFESELKHLKKWLGVEPEVIACDMHPLYETSKLAKELDGTTIHVQHHHAHHVSCMEDNQLDEACFGIILDGTGYGDDGHIWGFELLYGDADNYERLAHLQYSPLPGGEKAVKEPWRTAVGLLLSSFGLEEGKALAIKRFPTKQKEIEMISVMVSKNINSPLAGTCGRLFDAVSALTGVCLSSTYDGEAAIRLAELINENEKTNRVYPFDVIVEKEIITVETKKMLTELIEDINLGVDIKEISLKFHETVVQMCVRMLEAAVKNKQDARKQVVLSGGSFHNRYVTKSLVEELEKRNYKVNTHKKVPCSDGGISLGQLIIASRKRRKK